MLTACLGAFQEKPSYDLIIICHHRFANSTPYQFHTFFGTPKAGLVLSRIERICTQLVLHPASNQTFSTACFAICRVVVSQRCHRIASFLRLAD